MNHHWSVADLLGRSAAGRLQAVGLILLLANVRGFFFNPHRPDGLTFRAEAPPANILIKPARPEQDGSGLHSGLECRAYGSRTVDPDLRAFAMDLMDGRFRVHSEVR